MTASQKMKAIFYQQYGTPDVLRLEEVNIPKPLAHEVLIHVKASNVSVVDTIFRKGSKLDTRLFTGLFKPKKTTPGGDLAGEVVAIGKAVKQFKVGDQVYASTPEGFGAHAQYVCMPEDGAIALMPHKLDYTAVASIPYGALTALPFLRDTARIKAHQKVLIIGASGSVGAQAVQLAKYFGTEVTGICSSSKVEMVKSLGADKVLDYATQDIKELQDKYDIIFDTGGHSSFTKCKAILNENGVYITAVMSLKILLQMLWTSKLSQKKAMISFTGIRAAKEQAQDLNFLSTLIEEDKLKPIVDRTYPLEQFAQAHQYVEQGHKQGNVVLSFSN